MADVQRELEQLAAVGHCVAQDVIPPDRIAALREHVVRGREAAQREYAAIGGDLTSQRTADGGPGKKVVAYVPEFAAYLADDRILAIARGALDRRVRIAQIEFKFRPAADDNAAWRSWHSDWPHDLKDNERAGFRPAAVSLTSPWRLRRCGCYRRTEPIPAARGSCPAPTATRGTRAARATESTSSVPFREKRNCRAMPEA